MQLTVSVQPKVAEPAAKYYVPCLLFKGGNKEQVHSTYLMQSASAEKYPAAHRNLFDEGHTVVSVWNIIWFVDHDISVMSE